MPEDTFTITVDNRWTADTIGLIFLGTDHQFYMELANGEVVPVDIITRESNPSA